MSEQFVPTVLDGALVRLEPLATDHVPGLERAAEGARATPSLATVPTPEGVEDYVRHNLERQAGGAYLPFAQVEVATGRVLGHTAFLTPRTWPDGRLLAVEVGSSWLAPDMRGTAVNSASKMLLLSHAFEDWQVVRVDIKTDVRNSAARAGIRAVGARFEGILRNWQPSLADGEAGRPRDTAMFSITATEWPDVRQHLQERIATKLAARG
ncbi:GNAT family protein [Actinomyces sp.]|uniref:GNAT family N-acetyltransferase n=1 Tax=Actinomyces sp. TaxID=29317 RepID=UPI002899DED0|nr:GNAT family protein [Actinomyces sp.]